VERYLRARKIDLPPPSSLRYAPLCMHPTARRYLPAMVAMVEHIERGVVGVHRTYLRTDGPGKAAVAPAKASLGPIGGGAVRLGLLSARDRRGYRDDVGGNGSVRDAGMGGAVGGRDPRADAAA
jgi:hypothetical protein